jgi:hypothetical protein
LMIKDSGRINPHKGNNVPICYEHKVKFLI